MITLIDCLFRCLLEEELFTQACETLTDIVSHDNSIKLVVTAHALVLSESHMHTHIHTHTHAHRYPKAVRKFLQRVLELRDFIRTKLEENDTVIPLNPATPSLPPCSF